MGGDRLQQLEDASRMERTVLVAGLAIKANERDIFEFFVGKAGKVGDVQIIRDARNGRSKGVAYVELDTHEGMAKALGMNGQAIRGQAVRIQPSNTDGGFAGRGQT